MPEFVKMYNRQKKWTLYLLSVYVLGWGFTTYQTIFLGLILGTCFSFLILTFLIRRMKSFDKAITKGKKVRSLGSISRLALGAIAALIALKYPKYFNIVSVTVGLMTCYLVIMIDYLYHSFFSNKKV